LNKANVVDAAQFNHHAIRDVEVIIYKPSLQVKLITSPLRPLHHPDKAIALDMMYEQRGALARKQIPFLNKEEFILMTGCPSFIYSSKSLCA
jgi:hypothetical protein